MGRRQTQFEGLTQVWADELKDRNVRVNAVNPGGTRTRMRADAYPDEDPAKVKEPKTLGEAFIRLALTKETGRSFDIDAEGVLR